MIARESTLVASYFENSKNKVFKILPLIEEKNLGVCHYVNSLLFELYGLQHVITGVKQSSNYISLLCGLESLLKELNEHDRDFKFIRSEIFRLIGLVDKIQRGE